MTANRILLALAVVNLVCQVSVRRRVNRHEALILALVDHAAEDTANAQYEDGITYRDNR